MQNKGFVKLFAIALALVCLFYLSFNAVTAHYNSKAAEYANGNKMNEYHYLDSMATEKVWLGYTLKECRENELNMGLDLKGGMNVILEVSVPDIVRTLSGNTKDETFNKAINLAIERQAVSQKDFLVLFQEAYEEIDPNARLSAVFTTFDLKDRIFLKSTNKEVIDVLKQEVQATVDNSFNVLRTRIDRFGVVQPNIQRLETNGRILIELPGIKEPERVRKLLQGSASLEFWETYNLTEIYSSLELANAAVREYLKGADTTSVEKNTEKAKAEVAKSEKVVSESDSIKVQLEKIGAAAQDSSKMIEQFAKENPLFSIMMINQSGGQLIPTPAIAMVSIRDTAKVNEYLNLRQVKEILPRDLAFRWTVKPIDEKGLIYQLVAIKITNRDGKAPLGGNVITDARNDLSQFSANSTVSMTMNPEGAKTWARLTKENIGRSIAIVLDNMVYSFPTVNTEISGGRSEISGNFTTEEAKDLANVLKSGKMPAPSRIVQEDVVGPSLGHEAITQGLWSFLIAFIVVMLYMILMYGLVPGLIVDVALLANVFFLVGILASFKAVLTLPGIAGIVLTMGMAVDANVLIYERIKEELAAGKTHKSAVSDGYKNALSAIIDSNLTTLLTGVILFYFGTGPIKGFATTLIIGIITSFFTAVFITRVIYDKMVDNGSVSKLTFVTSFSKNLLQGVNVNWIKIRKFGYILSCAFVLIAIVSLSVRGLNQGVDFTGGRNYVVRFAEKVDTEEIKQMLAPGFTDASVSVITIGDENQVRISTNYKIADNSKTIDDEVEDIIYKSLQPKLAKDGVSKEMFIKGYIIDNGKANLSTDANVSSLGVQSSQKVGPAIANDIKNAAFMAVVFSLIVIFLYILVRFRNVSYSVGALSSLVHDTIFILGIYSLAYTIMPFSMEIDQAFIAAILTVIGYSINDTVVVFDRVRELKTNFPKRNQKDVINEAVNATLVRTFSTSFSTFIVLLVIFMLGGETIRGFVFALMVGVLVGTYSTLFIAVPVSYDISKKKSKAIQEAPATIKLAK
ncbi:MAG: bifunctional preprotein translocase subunit SecD/SecF [Bacteroidetes bacterium ADurb.Bin302]|nr:MAG: bifunctional preprotein translocase subunit SecD/SecF [Bacteroidetes bacterium ADurb.Bin302]